MNKQIIKVCLEKTTALLQEAGKKDYKKVKYWLKIAHTMSSQISREEDFETYLKSIQETYKQDKELLDIIEDGFISNT